MLSKLNEEYSIIIIIVINIAKISFVFIFIFGISINFTSLKSYAFLRNRWLFEDRPCIISTLDRADANRNIIRTILKAYE